MDIEAFRTTQAPLRERYTQDTKAAFLTLKAQGVAGEGTVTCKVDTGRGLATAGIHPKAGGSGRELCSGDMLLEALVACAGVTLCAVATAIGVELGEKTVIRAEGDLDFRGTLGVSKEVPVGFQNIRLAFDLDTHATAEQIASLIKLTERYCVVYQTLRQPAAFTVSHSEMN